MILPTLADLIPHRPAEQRFWVVRASSGQYIRHFLDRHIIAIGHLDGLGLKDGEIPELNDAHLRATLASREPDKSKAAITSQLNQFKAFTEGMSIGDLVVTLDSNSLIVGRIISDAYIDNKPVTRRTRRNKEHSMTYCTRRDVSWGPTLRRSTVPAAVEVSLFAHQTVFSIDNHWQIIYHLLYPFFFYEDSLYLSVNIRQVKALDTYSVSQLFNVLSGVEVIARTLEVYSDGIKEAVSKERESYSEIYDYFVQQRLFTLTSKAEFMSPGSIWSKIDLAPKGMLYMCIAYTMVFGAEVAGFKADGIIDKEMRHKIFDMVVQMMKAHDAEVLMDRLKPSLPEYNTKPLEDKSLDKTQLAENS